MVGSCLIPIRDNPLLNGKLNRSVDDFAKPNSGLLNELLLKGAKATSTAPEGY